MKKEWWLAAGVTLATLALALATIRHFAPGLLGTPMDLQLVQLDERQPAFFSGVFRMEDVQSTELSVKDPITGIRGTPAYPNLVSKGPHDLLGFRNDAALRVADLVIIGDSQTYGVNASMALNWPHQLEAALGRQRLASRVYAMAVGGWAAPQYLHVGQISGALRPRVIIVAFYAGNDPLESFMHVYGSEQWAQLRPDTRLTASDAPTVQVPVPTDKQWRVPLEGDLSTIMLVEFRRANLRRNAAVDAGWVIMKTVATRLAEQATAYQATLIVALIPTKETAYARLIEQRAVAAPKEYADLLAEEAQRHQDFSAYVAALGGARFVDVSARLQEALLAGEALYPADSDGHPGVAGYAQIAAAIEQAAAPLLPRYPCGPVRFESRDGVWHQAVASGDGRYWLDNTGADSSATAIDERMVESMRELAEPGPEHAFARCE